MMASQDFPRLTSTNHQITSPENPDYNCIAWAAGDTEHWWQPGVYWPLSISPDEFGIAVLEQAFASAGFEICADGHREPGYEKIALFGSSLFYTHAARQLTNGKWSSKLGRAEDIEHETVGDIGGGVYGEVVQFMRRALKRIEPQMSEQFPAPNKA